MWTAAELMNTEFPPIRYAVDGLLAEGVNLLVAPPKIGKSWLALDLAIGIGGGGQVLGSIPVDVGPVLVLALEDSPRRLRARLDCLLDGPAPGAVDFVTEWPGATEGREMVDRWLTNHPDARLAVIDVLQRIRPPASPTDRDLYGRDYAALAWIADLARRHKVAFVVVHHTRKAAADDYLDTVSGTHGLAGSADATLVLSRSRGAADAKLSVTGRDVPEADLALSFDAGKWTALNRPAADYDLTDQRRQILDVLRASSQPMTPKAIAKGAGHDYEATKKLVQRMATADQLTTDGTGRYRVPDPPVPLSPLSPLSLGGHQGHEGHPYTGVNGS